MILGDQPFFKGQKETLVVFFFGGPDSRTAGSSQKAFGNGKSSKGVLGEGGDPWRSPWEPLAQNAGRWR